MNLSDDLSINKELFSEKLCSKENTDMNWRFFAIFRRAMLEGKYISNAN